MACPLPIPSTECCFTKKGLSNIFLRIWSYSLQYLCSANSYKNVLDCLPMLMLIQPASLHEKGYINCAIKAKQKENFLSVNHSYRNIEQSYVEYTVYSYINIIKYIKLIKANLPVKIIFSKSVKTTLPHVALLHFICVALLLINKLSIYI